MARPWCTAARSAVCLLVAAGAIAGRPTAASAGWQVSGRGTPAVAAAAVSMPTGIVPTVTGSGSAAARTFTVSWPAPAGPIPIEGYQVTRSSSLLGAGLISGGTCVGVTTALGLQRVVVTTGTLTTYSCTDTALVAVGTVRYTVTPVYRKWVGGTSNWSSPTT